MLFQLEIIGHYRYFNKESNRPPGVTVHAAHAELFEGDYRFASKPEYSIPLSSAISFFQVAMSFRLN